MSTMKEKFVRYVDAGFPLIYLNTFEEDKADEMIRSVSRGKGLIEWNARGFFDYKESVSTMGQSLFDTLELLLSDDKFLKRKILVLKDAHSYLDNPDIIARLKVMARLINNGLEDFNIIIVSPIVKIPKELENYLTILTIDYLSQNEIRKIIQTFCKEQEISPLQEVFLNELSLTFKGYKKYSSPCPIGRWGDNPLGYGTYFRAETAGYTKERNTGNDTFKREFRGYWRIGKPKKMAQTQREDF